VPVSPVMARLIAAILDAAGISGGLVDGTLVGEIERAGYEEHFAVDRAIPVAAALVRGPARAPAGPRPVPLWEVVSLDLRAGTVTRPPGLRFDSGGIAKGLFGDILAGVLEMHPSFALDCAGDISFGGSAGLVRPVNVASPFADSMRPPLRADLRRGRDERHRPAQLGRRRRQAGPPPARRGDRAAGVHGRSSR
jgi:thiamine biosynthesis lipoprotein ApbE